MNSDKVLTLAKRRGFLWPSSEIYGGIAGFYDYGPLGSSMKKNIEEVWRNYYVLGEGFAEISSTMIAPEEVFIASGHVNEFKDFLIECTKCGEVYRADHLVKAHSPVSEGLSASEIEDIIESNNIKCSRCKGPLSKPKPFNLMFELDIGAGPKGGRKGYLRPETAQGIFVNFSLLYRHFREKMPFGVVQIGPGFRNEISPRQGVIRLRELNMAEAELFIRPNEDSWAKFKELSEEKLTLVTNENEEIRTTLDDAVKRGIIKRKVLGYFVALTQRFLVEVGVDPKRLRFRQHMKEEMAHYAADCWDAEAETSFGWIEVVGIADRTCYDLQGHIKHSKQDLSAFERFEEPTEIETRKVVVRQEVLGPKFKNAAVKVKAALEKMDAEQLEGRDSIVVEVEGKSLEIGKECFNIEIVKEKTTGKRYIPEVIEPSYGIDRIFYTVLEHAYNEQDDYVVLRLNPKISPIKAGVFPLMAKAELISRAKSIDERLRNEGVMTHYDDSGSIGRRYARMDEAGTPFCITIDYDTLEDDTVTIRERDSKEQVRVKIIDILNLLEGLLKGKLLLRDIKP